VLQEDRCCSETCGLFDPGYDLLRRTEEAERACEGDGVLVGDPVRATFDGEVPVLGVDQVGVHVGDFRWNVGVDTGRRECRLTTALRDAGADRLEHPCVPFHVVGHHGVSRDDDLELFRVAAGRARAVADQPDRAGQELGSDTGQQDGAVGDLTREAQVAWARSRHMDRHSRVRIAHACLDVVEVDVAAGEQPPDLVDPTAQFALSAWAEADGLDRAVADAEAEEDPA